MPDYQKGKIYRIWDSTFTKCYIGSTCESLSQRMSSHRKNYKTHKIDGKGFTTADMLFDEYGIENCKIEIIENYPCNSKAELHAREGQYQRENERINKNIAGRNMKQYNEDNKDKRREYNKQRYETHKEHILHKCKQWKMNNPDKRKEQSKRDREKRKENVQCECGCMLQKNTITRHKQSSKHQNYINQMNQQEQINSS